MPGAAIDLAAYLDPIRVAFFADGQTQRDAVIELAELAGDGWTAAQRTFFIKALFDREAVTTTAIGGGIAVPHARLAHLDQCSITLGIAPHGIPWNARDEQPVSLIVLIAAREQERTEHLRLLAAVATLLRDPQRRATLLTATTAADAVAALTR